MEIFKKKVIIFGDSLGVTIPKDYVKFSGIKAGDIIKITYTKIN